MVEHLALHLVEIVVVGAHLVVVALRKEEFQEEDPVPHLDPKVPRLQVVVANHVEGLEPQEEEEACFQEGAATSL